MSQANISRKNGFGKVEFFKNEDKFNVKRDNLNIETRWLGIEAKICLILDNVI